MTTSSELEDRLINRVTTVTVGPQPQCARLHQTLSQIMAAKPTPVNWQIQSGIQVELLSN